MTVPNAQLSLLHRADGSATYSQGGYTVIGAVNGPIEVTRRDELPQEAAIEVNVRPAVGVGSPRERHMESIIHSTLRHVILTHNHPRTLIQLTLQIASTPTQEPSLPNSQTLSLLPALLNASIYALLSASIPLQTTYTALCISVSADRSLTIHPSPKEILQATSTHVFAFSSTGTLVLDQSEGEFDIDIWDDVYDKAKGECCDPVQSNDDMEQDRETPTLQTYTQRLVHAKVEADRGWKNAPGENSWGKVDVVLRYLRYLHATSSIPSKPMGSG